MWSLTKRCRSALNAVASVLLATSLVACGFELRGQSSGAETLSRYPVMLVSAAPSSEFSGQLRNALQRQGASLSSTTDAGLTLYVDLETFEQRSLSLTARARAAEIELQASVVFSLRLNGEWLIEDETVTVVDQMLNDPLNVVGKTEQLRLLQEELRTALVAALTRRLNYTIAAHYANQT